MTNPKSGFTVLTLAQLLEPILKSDTSLKKKVMIVGTSLIGEEKGAPKLHPVRAVGTIEAHPPDGSSFRALALSANPSQLNELTVLRLAEIVTNMLETDRNIEVVVSSTPLAETNENGTIYFVHQVFNAEEKTNHLNALIFFIDVFDDEGIKA